MNLIAANLPSLEIENTKLHSATHLAAAVKSIYSLYLD